MTASIDTDLEHLQRKAEALQGAMKDQADLIGENRQRLGDIHEAALNLDDAIGQLELDGDSGGSDFIASIDLLRAVRSRMDRLTAVLASARSALSRPQSQNSQCNGVENG